MITNFGKNIISKYLLGQIDSYANYIAIGSAGASTQVTQQSLNFEAARYPVISKGISIDSNSNRQLVFTAQIDSLDRFDITEIGLYPAAYDSLISNSVGSKILLDFSINELWSYNDASTYNSPLTFISNPLDYGNTTNILDSQADGATTLKAYSFDASNSFFTTTRINRKERPRILDSAFLILGDMSTTYNTGKYVELTGFNNATDLDNASDSVDELRVAFNVINTTTLTTVPSGGVQFTIRFMTNDGQTYRDYVFDTTNTINSNTTWIQNIKTDKTINTQTPSGTTNITISTSSSHNFSVGENVVLSGITPSEYNGTWVTQTGTTGSTLVLNIGSNPGAITVGGTASSPRYLVGKQALNKGTSSGDFRWSAVNAVKIYGKATDSTSTANYAIIFDAVRFENNSTTNPLYGLIGYSVPSSNIVKASDTSGLVEFRFNLGVA